jgi:hypothetical protein
VLLESSVGRRFCSQASCLARHTSGVGIDVDNFGSAAREAVLQHCSISTPLFCSGMDLKPCVAFSREIPLPVPVTPGKSCSSTHKVLADQTAVIYLGLL